MPCSVIGYDDIKLNDIEDKVIAYPACTILQGEQTKKLKNGD